MNVCDIVLFIYLCKTGMVTRWLKFIIRHFSKSDFPQRYTLTNSLDLKPL